MNNEDGPAFNLFEAAELPDSYFPIYVDDRPRTRQEIVLAVAKALYYRNADVIPIAEDRRERMKNLCRSHGYNLDEPDFDPAMYG